MSSTASSTVLDTGVATATYVGQGDASMPNVLVVPVDFGTTGTSDMASTTVTAEWVKTRGPRPTALITGREDQLDNEDALVEEMLAIVCNIVDGVSFDVVCHAPNGTAGVYLVQVTGAQHVR
jgi:hypothetical protein